MTMPQRHAPFHRLTHHTMRLLGEAILASGSELAARDVTGRCVPDTIARGFLLESEVPAALAAVAIWAAEKPHRDATWVRGAVDELLTMQQSPPTHSAADVWPEDVEALQLEALQHGHLLDNQAAAAYLPQTPA